MLVNLDLDGCVVDFEPSGQFLAQAMNEGVAGVSSLRSFLAAEAKRVAYIISIIQTVFRLKV